MFPWGFSVDAVMLWPAFAVYDGPSAAHDFFPQDFMHI
jgi:hypothetical protein